jgi:phosphoribosylglycinamide formyltransferase-1
MNKFNKMAVFISGSGSNLQAIIDNIKNGSIPGSITCVISDKKDAYGLTRANEHGIPTYVFPPKDYTNRKQHEEAIIETLRKYDTDFIVLAGYMRLLTEHIINTFENKILNIHPALLPSFPGTDGYGDAWQYGVKISGCTVHFVDTGCDTGPIIMQGVTEIEENDSLDNFKKRGLSVEHSIYPKAVKAFCEGRVQLQGRKVTVLPEI